MYQNCFTAGPFAEMKSTLCQVHQFRPRVYGSLETPRALPSLQYSLARRKGREEGEALSISVCNQPFHQFSDIARCITFGMTLTMTAIERCVIDYT